MTAISDEVFIHLKPLPNVDISICYIHICKSSNCESFIPFVTSINHSNRFIIDVNSDTVDGIF